MKFILYARKSSESADRQIQSLPDQNKVLTELADRTGLTITESLEEARSAKEPGTRPVFSYMLQHIKDGNADAILCWSINRLCRNPVDAGELAWLLQRGILKSIRTIDREYRPEDSALLMSFETGMATQYIIDLSKNVKRGLHEKAARGWWPTKPPPGYRTNPFTHEIEPDPDNFPLMRQAWELVLSRSYTIPQVLEKLSEWGYADRTASGQRLRPMTRSCLYRHFANPFYYGPFLYGGELREGRHPPMVSQAEFERVQQIISSGGTTRPQRIEFAFTGLIRCGVCGCMITATKKIKSYPTTGNRREYVYYHCTGAKGCARDSVPEAYLDSEVQQLVARCNTRSNIEPWIHCVLRRDLSRNPLADQNIRDSQYATRQAIERKLDALFDMRSGGEITAEEFATRKGQLQMTLSTIENEQRRVDQRWNQNLAALSRASRFSRTAYERFTSGGPTAKRQIASLVADAYSLTLGNLKIEPNPIFDILRTFEPPKEGSDMVHDGSLMPARPIQRSGWDYVRTLLTEVDLRFDDATYPRDVEEAA